VLLKKMRDRLFSEKHVDCNLALDVLYHAAAELSKNRVKDASEILAAESPRSCINEDFGVALCEISDMLHFVETQDFPAILQQFRRDTLRLVKDTLANKKKAGEGQVDTEESRVARLEDIGRRMLRVFIMEVVFHENILAAFREKIARARQEELIQEEEEKKKRDEERRTAKREKKAKKRVQKNAVKEEERQKKEEEDAKLKKLEDERKEKQREEQRKKEQVRAEQAKAEAKKDGR
jgi:flagellar biosynthesis GTPase FlhF